MRQIRWRLAASPAGSAVFESHGIARLLCQPLAQLPRSKGFFGQFRRVMLLFAALVPFQA
jgi:hypothetical protein